MRKYLTREDRAVRILHGDIENKTVLEAACGRATFALRAAQIAREVYCFDIKDKLLPPDIADYDNIHFEIMDAAALGYADDMFDTAVFYNAIGHLDAIIPQAITECRRVVKPGGRVVIISTSKMDKTVIREILAPWLDAEGVSYELSGDRNFTWVII